MTEARPTTLGMALAAGRTRLERDGVDGAALDAALLLGQVAGLARATLLAHPERPLDDVAWADYATLLDRRAAGEPVAYLLGRREFFGLELLVDRRVLVPRPETEQIVELAIAHLRSLPARPRCAVDVGTGSGAIALALAHAVPNLSVIAADLSPAALQVAAPITPGLAQACPPGAGSLLDCRPAGRPDRHQPALLRPDQAHAVSPTNRAALLPAPTALPPAAGAGAAIVAPWRPSASRDRPRPTRPGPGDGRPCRARLAGRCSPRLRRSAARPGCATPGAGCLTP
jgi:release factor glutamine methyltransferase